MCLIPNIMYVLHTHVDIPTHTYLTGRKYIKVNRLFHFSLFFSIYCKTSRYYFDIQKNKAVCKQNSHHGCFYKQKAYFQKAHYTPIKPPFWEQEVPAHCPLLRKAATGGFSTHKSDTLVKEFCPAGPTVTYQCSRILSLELTHTGKVAKVEEEGKGKGKTSH